MIDQTAFFSSVPEEAYTASVPDSHRKRLGQFFTPSNVAAFMAQWVVSNPSCRRILDPAVGLGMLLRAILDRPDADRFDLLGYDIDPVVLERARLLFSSSDYTNIELLHKDYMFNDWNSRYDGIICNPPYLKFQQYKNRTASLQEFESRLGMTLSGLTNIYTMFLLKSANQLSVNGRAAYIVPLEFLNADYGTMIKKYLLKSKTLRYIIIFDSDSNLFDNALTTSCILLLANDEYSDAVTFVDARSIADLSELQQQLISYPH
ncbi:MAG TPA: N-6 DNA methylase, partial [Herpetosiphonaceae bacterium]